MIPRELSVRPAARRRLIFLFALCSVLTLASAVYFVRYLAKPNTGLVVNYPEVVVLDGKVIFFPKAPFSPAVSAGLRPGEDEILAVNGKPVHGSLDILRADGSIRTFAPFSVDVLRNETERLTLNVTPSFMLSRIDWLFVLLFALILAYTAFTLTLRIPADPGTVPLVLAALSYLVFTCVKPFYYENLLSNSLIHLGKITSWFLVFFGLYFPERRGSRGTRLSLIGCICVLYAVFFFVRIQYFTAWTASGEEIWLERYRFLGQIGNVSDGVAYVTWAALMAGAYLRSTQQARKRQLQWILAGIMMALPPYFFFDQLPLILGQSPAVRISLGSFAELFLAFIPIFIIAGLTRRRVFNIRFLLTRYAIFTVLFVFMFACFCLLYLPLRNAFSSGFRLNPPLGDFFTAAFFFVILVPLQALVSRFLEKAIYGRKYRDSPHYIEELENKNSELALGLEQLSLKREHAFQTEKLVELRPILRGIAERIRDPAHKISSGLIAADSLARADPQGAPPDARQALDQALEASIQVGDVLRTLESLCGPLRSVAAFTTPETLLRTAVERVRSKFGNSLFNMEMERTGKIACYPEELVDALVFVLDNAVEAQEGSSQPLMVRAGAAGSHIFIEIEDGGVGISESMAKKLFQPFITNKHGHLGLGLYFARLISQRNEGTLELHARAVGGTKARFVFPVARPGEGE